MKTRTILYVGLWVSLLHGTAALSQTRGSQILINDPARAETIMTALEDSVWVADGTQADKQIYVVYSTECGFSDKMFKDTRSLTSKAQFRWVTHCCSPSGDAILENRDPAEIAKAYARTFGAAGDPARSRRAMDMNIWAASTVDSNLAYPMVIYRTANGVAVNYGAPADLDKMIESVASRADRADYHPRGLDQLNKPLQLASAGTMKAYYNSADAPVPLYAQPDFTSQKVVEIPKDMGYEVLGFANGEWIAVKGLVMGGHPVPGYVHAPTDVRLASLQFTVSPATGLVQPTTPLDIRLQPDMDAEVVDRLEPGYQMNKTGEVELNGRRWTEILLYTDGTKGYLLQ